MARLRRSDLVVALGLVVLLFAVPTYATQEGMDAEAHRAQRFDLPQPRAGDTLTTELVLQVGSAEPVTIAPFRTISARLPEEGECPPTTAFVIQRITHAGTVRFPGGVFEQKQGHRNVECFDHDGIPLGSAFIWPDGQRSWGRFDGTNGALSDGGAHVHYSPDKADLWFSNLDDRFREMVGEETWTTDRTSDKVAIHRGFRLYADTADSAVYNIIPLPEPRHERARSSDEVNGMRFDEPVHYTREATWQWMARSVPFEVGHHSSRHAEDGSVAFSYDELPLAFVRGEGMDLQRRAATYRDSRDLQALASTDVPSLRLRDLEDDVRPIYEGLSLRALAGQLDRAALPASTRALRDAGGTIVGFAWHDQPPDVDGTPRSQWYVALATAAGAVNIVRLELDRAPDWRIVEAVDICDKSYISSIGFMVYLSCDSLDPRLVDGDREITDPLYAYTQAVAFQRQRARTPLNASEETFHGFVYAPVYVAAPYNRPEAGPFRVDIDLNGRLRAAHDALPSGVATWYDEASAATAAGVVDLRDGLVLMARLPGTPPSDEPLGLSGAGAERLRFYDGTGVALTTGGALLVLFGLAVRGVAWAKGGGLLPGAAFLYARIERDRALDHERREALVELLSANPGLTVSDIHRRTGFGWGATMYHLQTLKRTGIASATPVGNRTHWFLSGAGSKHERLTQAFSTRPEYQAFLEAVSNNPGITLKELEQSLAQRRSSLSKVGTTLAAAGVVTKKRDGASVRFFVKEAAVESA